MLARRVSMVVVGGLLAAFFVLPGIALAYDETTSTIPAISEANCGNCHDPYFSMGPGVHGGYTATTSKCEECHSVHQAPTAGSVLLPGATITATCFTCHDGTQGRGVYGAIAARGLTVGAKHRSETTSVVPGGDPNSGGSKTMTFTGKDGALTCSDCHSPHGSSIVTAFPGDRKRNSDFPPLLTTKMLKQRPGGTTTATVDYGSDWCLSCHQGRNSGLSSVHNHPAESASTYANATTRFNYNNVARLSAGAGASTTPTGALGGNNGGYLMPFPRTAQQTGHLPICQQCHEDARNVGALTGDGATGTVTPYAVVNVDGNTVTDNPRFQNFPHETTGYRMLVEASTTGFSDDLCLNCHPMAQLP